MNIKKMLCLLLVVVLPIYLCACQNNSVKDTKSITAKKETNSSKSSKTNKEIVNEELLQKKINDYLVENHLNGSVFVGRNNQVFFNGAVGYANVGKKLLNQTSTTFPIASITKVFVATSIMQLQEKHKLNIQDPVSKYIPDFPNGSKIKLYNLLTHTSGLQTPQWNGSETTPLSLVNAIEKMPLKFSPGQGWDYRDVNYMVLGYILEKTTGTTLHNYIQKNIIKKLHMKQTGFIRNKRPVPYTAVSYVETGKQVQTTQLPDIYHLYGCGDIYSSTHDLAKFDKALMNGKLVSKVSLNQMLTPSSKHNYGLGLYLDSEKSWSNGFLYGWSTTHGYFKDKTQIVVLLNVKDKNTNPPKVLTDLYSLVKTLPNEQNR